MSEYTTWFDLLMGVPESEWRETYIPALPEIKTNQMSLRDLNKQLFSLTGSTNGAPVESKHSQIRIINVAKSEDMNVMKLQRLPKNRGAMFQVASNFNGLENISPHSSANEPDFLSNYIDDPTQGPYASISAGYAAIERWKLNAENEINILKQLKPWFPLHNGYVALADQTRSLSEQEDSKLYWKLMGRVNVLWHENVQVTFDEHFRLLNDPNQTIHQVLTASLNISQGENGEQNQLQDEKRSFAHTLFLLKAAYLSAYHAAFACRATKLFLTLVGGGVFGVPHEWIYQVINLVHRAMKPPFPVYLYRVDPRLSASDNGLFIGNNSI